MCAQSSGAQFNEGSFAPGVSADGTPNRVRELAQLYHH
jgi:hypothetical protein